MKVTNWRRKLMASLVAAGALAPGMSYALDIPLGDPSFDLYVVPAATGYAYAADPFGAYRVGPPPISPWVDDLDSPPGFTQDNGNSNWLYDSNYGETGQANNDRPFPRTGNQAMHGLDGNFNAQELATTFQADKTYRFSVWAQNDVLLDQGDGLGLYVFNANVPFSIANSLSQANFTTTVSHRTAGMTAVQSKANWSQHTVQHTVFAGDPLVGQPIGVAFRAFRDTAVDDATLTVDDASNFLLSLEVNTTNGQVRMRNQTGTAVKIDYYDVKSVAGALNATAWNSLQEQNLPGFPAGNGSGNGWEQAGGSASTVIGESYLTGNSSVGNAATVGLGAAFNVGGAHDLIFQYGQVLPGPPPTGDYNNNGVVDGADYVVWRNAGPTDTLPNDSTPGTVNAADYAVWRQQFGASSTAPSTLLRGLVRYVTAFSGSGGGAAVPEPASIALVGLGTSVLLVGSRSRKDLD